MAETLPGDDHLSPEGQVMEILSEHTCQGWLEGYLLTGRHGFFSCYEAFIHLVDSMFNQHAKWLKVAGHEIPWRRPIASLNYLLTSHVWRQDHNGFSHQDPGFIDHVVNKKADVIRVYLPPDANTLLAVTDTCLAQPQSGQRDRGRQAAAGSLAHHGPGDPALRDRHRHLGMGEQRSRR
jgi:xylulose-5-phosphate/fructose-6-phosphate phosphoketolase